MTARPRKKTAELGVDLKLRIEEVATRLFIARGYNGVSYLDVARELSVTHPTIHYYYRTKSVLAEAVLRRVAEATLESMQKIWVNPDTSLLDKFIGTRAWMYEQYLQFNPDGKGGHLWGLLGRFTLDADSLTSDMRRLIRGSLRTLENHIATGIEMVVRSGELVKDAPQDGITLQITSLMAVTGQVTRYASGFERLDDLLRWTYVGIARAYGAAGPLPRAWPELAKN